MECQQLHRDELAEKYLNGRLHPSARDEFEVHLLECADCQRHVEAREMLRQELSETALRIRAYPRLKP